MILKPDAYRGIARMNIEIIDDPEEKSRICERVLRALPEWFGIESSIVRYVADVRDRKTWAAFEGAGVVGFLSVTRHFPETAEIHVMGVLRAEHGRKIGSQLVATAARDCAREGVRFLTVKTLSPAHPDAGYAATRAFYRRQGFLPLEEFPTLWGAANPCLFLVKSLAESLSDPDARRL